MKGVRYARQDGWEGYCPVCLDWYPVDLEFWPSHLRGGMCRACFRQVDAERHRAVREQHPELKLRDALRAREYRAGLTLNERRAIYEKRREKLLARRREWWANRSPERKAAHNAKSAAWREANRERLRADQARRRAERRRAREIADHTEAA